MEVQHKRYNAHRGLGGRQTFYYCTLIDTKRNQLLKLIAKDHKNHNRPTDKIFFIIIKY